MKTGYDAIGLPDTRSHYRADFIVKKEKVDRRKGSLLGLPAYYQSPESFILAKLRMIKATHPPERSLKDRNDIIAIIKNTRVNTGKIQRVARLENTLEIYNNIRQKSNRKNKPNKPQRPPNGGHFNQR